MPSHKTKVFGTHARQRLMVQVISSQLLTLMGYTKVQFWQLRML